MTSADRPTLRKADDAGVHPATPMEPESPFLRRGSTTADAIGAPDKDRLVDLRVRIPKSLRKSVRAESYRRGVSVDEIVAEALRDRPLRG